MEERSLDEFVETADTGADTEDETPADGATDTDENTGEGEEIADSDGNDRTSRDADSDGRVLPESVEPAAVTSRVVPGRTTCEGCGEQVSRLWTSEDGERCRDCKEW